MNWQDDEAPEGWTVAPLGEVAKVTGGGTPKTTVLGNFSNFNGHPWVTPADLTQYTKKRIGRGRRYLTDQGLATSSAKYMPAGTVLFSSRAPIGYVAIAENPITTNQGFRSFTPSEMLDSNYLYHALQFLRPIAEQLASGTTFAELSGSKAAQIRIAFPSLPQQQSIAQFLDNTSELNRIAALRLISAKSAITQFRQAVLASACCGRLTHEWRGINSENVTQSTSPPLISTGNRRRFIAEPNSALVGKLPTGWTATTLSSLVDRIEAGKSFSALGRPATDQEWGVIKVSAMSWGRFLEVENKAVPESYQVNPRYEIRPGDLLLSRANTEELVGATVLVGETRPMLLLSDKSLRLVSHEGVDKTWLNFTLGSNLVRSQFSERATGTSDSMRNLSQEKILETTLPLPPLEEQKEIAKRVSRMLQSADQIEMAIETATACIKLASQAVLAKAFRGELLGEKY